MKFKLDRKEQELGDLYCESEYSFVIDYKTHLLSQSKCNSISPLLTSKIKNFWKHKSLPILNNSYHMQQEEIFCDNKFFRLNQYKKTQSCLNILFAFNEPVDDLDLILHEFEDKLNLISDQTIEKQQMFEQFITQEKLQKLYLKY